MFNSYYASQGVTVSAPSSIAGTLVKSHARSKMTCFDIGSEHHKNMFSEKPRAYCGTDYNRSWCPELYKPCDVLQVMLANDGKVFVEYVLKEDDDAN